MRQRIYEIIDAPSKSSRASTHYNLFMLATIVISLLPLTVKSTSSLLYAIDIATTAIFCVDYALRLMTADCKLNRGATSFAIYPITPLAIIDLLAILPIIGSLSSGYRILKLFRLFRTFRVFRAFKLFRYSKSLIMIISVIKKQKTPLCAVCVLAVGYIFVSALVVFNIEPETFGSFFDAIYWATVSLTTVGYGDIYPLTSAGRIVTMLSSFVGIAIVALPAGIITAGYMDEVQKVSTSDTPSD